MFASSEWVNIAQSAGGIATAATLLGAPAIYFFHKKIIRPLRWVLGVPAGESPSGEEIPPIPQQLAALRTDIRSIKVEMHPNGGSSMRDSLNRNELMTAQTHKGMQQLETRLEDHVVDDASIQVEITKKLSKLLKTQKQSAKKAKRAAILAAAEVAARTVERERVRRAEDIVSALRKQENKIRNNPPSL